MLKTLLFRPLQVMIALPIALGLTHFTTIALADVVVPTTTVARKPTSSACQKAAALDPNRVYSREQFVGEVEGIENGVDGTTISLKQDDQTLKSVFLPNSVGGDFERLRGKRIVLTKVVCTPPPRDLIVEKPPTPTPEDGPTDIGIIIPQQW